MQLKLGTSQATYKNPFILTLLKSTILHVSKTAICDLINTRLAYNYNGVKIGNLKSDHF